MYTIVKLKKIKISKRILQMKKILWKKEEQKINDSKLPFVTKVENLSENLLFNKGNNTIPMPMGIEIQPIKINNIEVSKIENITAMKF